MSPVPPNPKLYHVTHVSNLRGVVAQGGLWSDRERLNQNVQCTLIGMSEIKRRRLEELEVGCHPGTKVGDYVPFYFCPRSIMLYLMFRNDHPDLTYRGGQQPIVHLQSNLSTVVNWANTQGKRWAFSNGNAGTRYTAFFDSIESLGVLNWNAIPQKYWNDPDIREAKQSEFLVEEFFPWELVETIGVHNVGIVQQVNDTINGAAHQPSVQIQGTWYY